jgi:branched-subunit amino acid ABC-type transport system permease component
MSSTCRCKEAVLALSALVTLNVLNSIATLLLLSLGIGVIYGMMKVINFAHGEFLMLGAYATVIAANAGLNIWIAMLIIAPVSVGLFGLVVERCLIRHLYGRIIDTMLATWGLSLIIVGLVTSFIGTTIQGVSTPLGGLSIGSYQTSVYNLFIIVMAALVTLVLWATLRFTRYGMIVRATMQNPAMASALGVSPSRIYMGTFVLGSALAGLAGGIVAPISGVAPIMGMAYMVKAFITVAGGGAAIITGTSLAAGLFGLVNEVTTFLTTPVFGQVAMLATAVVMIRILPQGITGRFFRRNV